MQGSEAPQDEPPQDEPSRNDRPEANGKPSHGAPFAMTGPARSRAVIALLFVLAAVAIGAVLKTTVSIVMPLVIALLLSFVLSPLVEGMRKLGLPRIVGIILVILLLLGFGFLLGLVLYSSVQSLLRSWPLYQRKLITLFDQLVVALKIPDNFLSRLQLTQPISSMVLSFFGSFVGFLSSFLMVMIFLLFILLEKPYLRRKMYQAIHAQRTHTVYRILTHINSQVGRYLTVKFLVSLATGVSVGISYGVIGVDFAFIWGVLAFLFNFVPSIGSIVVSAASFLFAIVQFAPDWHPIVATIASMLVIQTIIGNIIDPKLQGDNLNLSPVIILFSLLFWGWLWGIMGMFLSVPLTVALKIIFENVPGFEFVGVLMGTGNFRPRKPKRNRKG